MYNNLRLVYITTPNKEEARTIGHSLVSNHLATCVNIIDGMESIYMWEGEIVDANETVLIAKAHYSKMTKLTEHVKQMHSYKCPCVITVSLSEQGGNIDYIKWLLGETK